MKVSMMQSFLPCTHCVLAKHYEFGSELADKAVESHNGGGLVEAGEVLYIFHQALVVNELWKASMVEVWWRPERFFTSFTRLLL